MRRKARGLTRCVLHLNLLYESGTGGSIEVCANCALQMCIDQHNQVEKGEQVRLMGEIYSKCNQCLIWMDDIADGIRMADAEAIIAVLDWMADSSLDKPACVSSTEKLQDPAQALSSISTGVHPWWNRIWTVQEAILPLKKSFLWGPLRLSWDTLTTCARIWVTSGGMDDDLERFISNTCLTGINPTMQEMLGWLFCNVIWINNARGTRDHPALTLIKWSNRQSTDPKDKVFGLLGLMPLDMELHYTSMCNYETPAAQIWAAFTLDMILFEGLFPLVVMQRKKLGGLVDGIPTWVHDFTEGTMQATPDKFYLYWGHEEYDACAGKVLDRTCIANEMETWMPLSLESQPILALAGVLVDAIVVTGPRIINISRGDSAKIAETLRIWIEIARQYHESINGELLGEAFAKSFYRVLVGDCIRNGEQWVDRRPNEQDFMDIAHFVETGVGEVNDIWFWDKYVGHQTFFVTKDGTMGMGSSEANVGDEVWVFEGGRMPFAIKAVNGGGIDDYTLVGCCYLNGIMDGEIYNGTRHTSGRQRRTIRLH